MYARLDAERIGAFAEYAVVREGAAALKPGNLTFAEAASLPLVALTAWQALVGIGGLRAGQRVLIHAGSGGVGSIAIQLARSLDATVLTTVGRRNADLVRSLGADVAIDYRTEKFEEVARDCDMVLDSAGGETLVRSFTCVRPGGTVVSIGGTPSAPFARRWGLNPLLVLALGIMSRKETSAARRHGVRGRSRDRQGRRRGAVTQGPWALECVGARRRRAARALPLRPGARQRRPTRRHRRPATTRGRGLRDAGAGHSLPKG